MNTPSHLKRRLRVGLLIDSHTQPRWARRVIEEIVASPIAEVALVVKNEGTKEGGASPAGVKLAAAWRNRRRLLYAAYTKADERWVKVEPAAFEPSSIAELVAAVPVVRVKPLMTRHTDSFSDEDAAEVMRYELDVALRFGFRILKGWALQIAKGVAYHRGDGLVNRGGPPARSVSA